MDHLIIRIIEQGGYFGIFLLMALENIIPPVPSEVIMGIGGMLVEKGSMQFWPLLIIGTAGTTAGNYFWYWIGDRFGYERLEPFVRRWGRWLTLDWAHIEAAQRFFVRRGQWVIFGFRFSPVFRTIISLPAGLTHMPLGKFFGYTFAGSLIWNGLLIKGGQWLGRYFSESQEVLAWGVVALIVVGLAFYAWRVATWTPRGED